MLPTKPKPSGEPSNSVFKKLKNWDVFAPWEVPFDKKWKHCQKEVHTSRRDLMNFKHKEDDIEAETIAEDKEIEWKNQFITQRRESKQKL